jgi:RNA polymerase sigma-70 factor (ECF subfamily)
VTSKTYKSAFNNNNMNTQTQQFLPSIATLSFNIQKEEPCELTAMCANISDEEMVERVKKSKECFECLVSRYDWKMKIYIKRITGAPNETVEDIVQEVFLKVYSNIEKFDQEKKFSSWLYRIAHNEAVNRLLYENRRRTESLFYDETGELKTAIRDSHDIWKSIQQENINEKLKGALSQVSKKYQDVILLNYFQEKSYQEISQELNKPINTIGTMLNRGKKMLKKELILVGMTSDVAMM